MCAIQYRHRARPPSRRFERTQSKIVIKYADMGSGFEVGSVGLPTAEEILLSSTRFKGFSLEQILWYRTKPKITPHVTRLVARQAL
eukprot:2007219-Prymnesium_polylepis.1